MNLHNNLSKKEALERLLAERFKRTTISFYRYLKIENPQEFRNQLFKDWYTLNCYGRIYVANEGINAQMSVPNHSIHIFIVLLRKYQGFEGIPIKYAFEDDGKSFYKLTIKVRHKIVADGLEDSSFDVTNVGNHLTPSEFHNLEGQKETITIDMRNHYESEVGKFKSAFCPNADTFRDAIKMVEKEYADEKDKKILLYCTGGIRCEKASAYLKHIGFKDVNQLHGGIIAYANEIKLKRLKSKFTGKNFVFDERLGESIDGKIISQCHQCGAPSDSHTNCANDDCHLLFIQCDKCAKKLNACCSSDCKKILTLPDEEQKHFRQLRHKKYSGSKIFKSRLRPDLKKILSDK